MIRHKAVVAAHKALKAAPIVRILPRGQWYPVAGDVRPNRRYALVPAGVADTLVEKLDRTDGRVRKDPSKRIRSRKPKRSADRQATKSARAGR